MGLLSGLWNAATWVWNQLQNVAPGFTEAVTNTVTTIVTGITDTIQNANESNNSGANTTTGTAQLQPEIGLEPEPQLPDLEAEFTGVDPIELNPAVRVTQNRRRDLSATLVSDEVVELADPSIDQRLRTFLDFVLANSPDDEIAGSARVAVKNLFALAGGQPLFENETEVTPHPPRRSEPLPPGVILALENNPGLWGEFQSTDPVEMEQEFRTKIFQRLMIDAEISFMELQPWNNASTEELLALYANTLVSQREQGPPPAGSSPDDILPIWIYQPIFSRFNEPKLSDSPLPGIWGIVDSVTPSTTTLDYNYLGPALETLYAYQAPLFDLDALIEEFGYVVPGVYTEDSARDFIIGNLTSLDMRGDEALTPASMTMYNNMDTLALANLWYNRIEPGDVSGTAPEDYGMFHQRLEGTYRPPDYELLVMAATTVLEPVDWIATGIEVFDDLVEGDFESAAVNAALAAMPLVSGWMDNAAGINRYDDVLFSGLPTEVGNHPLAIARRAAHGRLMQERGYPLGFNSREEFVEFTMAAQGAIREAGYTDAVVMYGGSAVSGEKYSTGGPFDVGRPSDFDLAVISPQGIEVARELGFGLRSEGTRTGPLDNRKTPDTIWDEFNLLDFAEDFSTVAGRDVNIMFYASEDALKARNQPYLDPNLGDN